MYWYSTVTVTCVFTTIVAYQLTFDASAIVEPEDAGAAEAGLLPKLTVVAVSSVVAAADGRSVAGAYFVADTDRSPSWTHFAIFVRWTNDAAARTSCGGKTADDKNIKGAEDKIMKELRTIGYK